MNILIPHSWLRDYIQTDLDPAELAELLSLHAFSVEKILEHENGSEKDFIYEIEVTPNRGDALSVMGIAREFKAILPAKGHPVSWKEIKAVPQEPVSVQEAALEASSGEGALKRAEKLSLNVEIADPDLVPRFSAVILDNVNIQKSPRLIRDRLEKVGIRSLNNVVDITNYLMIDWGQPMHVFDYDKIQGAKMIVRESFEGEAITTLDGVTRKLPEGVIVIEDGSGRLIDLCGIMGAENSEVDENTERVVLFVQVYDPVRIRKASMALGHRTDAALRFEKGIDYLGVVPSLWYATSLLQEHAEARLVSDLIDIQNFVYKEKKVPIDYDRISLIAGVSVDEKEVRSTLSGLGFEIEEFSSDELSDYALVPSWRYDDISIAEDLAEEVVRILGYENLPNKLPSGEVPLKTASKSFYWEDRIKDFLKYQGFFECFTTSATTPQLGGDAGLKLQNPLSKEFHTFRESLILQLLDVVESNKGYADSFRLFEVARIYRYTDENRKEGQLPDQPFMLGMVVKGDDYLQFKGVVEALLSEMGISEFQFEIKERGAGVLSLEIPLQDLVDRASKELSYSPIVKYNSIKEDITIKIPGGVTYPELVSRIKEVDSRVISVKFSDLYEDKLTLSLEFLDMAAQITSEDVQPIKEKILKKLR